MAAFSFFSEREKMKFECRNVFHQAYLQLYERYFSPFQVESFSLLEIGVDDGEALKMWRNAFPNARIFGIDISPYTYLEGESRITTLMGDAGNLKFLKTMMSIPNLKIVIDDAGHQYHQQITSFDFFFPKLPVGGFYVVEDLDVSPQIIHYLNRVVEKNKEVSIHPHRNIVFLKKEE